MLWRISAYCVWKEAGFMKLDPRSRLLLIVLLTTLAVLSEDVGNLMIVAGAAIGAGILCRISFLDAAKRLKHFLSLILFIAVVQSLTVKGGDILVHIGKVQLLTSRGIGFALEFVLRMSVILMAGLIASTAEGSEMTDGLLKLRMPYELAFMSAIALRYLPVFRDEFANRIKAIALRGIDIKKLSLWTKLKLYGYLITPAILGAMQKSEELARALNARGFRAFKKRTMLRELKLSYKDWIVMITALVFTAVFLIRMYTCGALLVL